MGKNITKKEFIRNVHFELRRSEEYIQIFILEDVFEIFIENIADCLVRGEKLYLRGFGTFSPLKSAMFKREYVCPVNGKIYEVEAVRHDKVFRSSKELFRKVNVGKKNVFQRYFNDSYNT